MTGFDNIDHAGLSDVGVRRSHNQDNYAILLASNEQQWQARGHIFIVADGMGAHAVGELASELAVGIIPHAYDKYAQQGVAAALRKAFVEANSSIHARGQQNREFAGMGTTATALVLRSEGVWIGHVGDSRAYRIRDSHIEQMSFDHSMVWEYARRQNMDPDAVQGIPSNVIFRSLGPEPLVPVDIEGMYSVRDGDIFVLCSDGLSGQLTDHEIGAIASVLPPDEACQFLIDLANLRGGPDNITVLIVRVGCLQIAATTPLPHKPWYRRVPWPLGSLLLGTLLAGEAAVMTYYDVGGVGSTFLFALLTIVVGLIGLVIYHRREQRRVEEEMDQPLPKIHRRQPCAIEPPLVDKLAKVTQTLQQQIQDRSWESDWESYQQHHTLAAECLARGDYSGAFREFCRAMALLTAALHQQRHKEEVFHPVWDKGEIRHNSLNPNGRDSIAYYCEHCGKSNSSPSSNPTPLCCEHPMKKKTN